jgi:hypothetical protein
VSYGDGEPMRDYDEDPRRVMRRDGSAPGLSHRIDALNRELARYEEQVDRAADLLRPILGPERPSPALNGQAVPEEPTSDLGRFLDEAAGRLGVLTGRLSYLLGRVDL